MPPKPRLGRSDKDKGLLYKVSRDSSDFKHLYHDMEETCRADDNIEYLWSMDTIWLVNNPEMEKRYERRRQQMRSLGRTADETKDTLVFVAEGWGNVHKMCKFGIRCREKKRNVLGDTQYGIHMNRNYDILVRFMAFKNFQQAKFIIVFKGMLGKVKLMKAKMRGDYGCVPPTPNYDCHLSDIKPDLKMEIGDAFAHNFAYVYEYDEETIMPVTFPSQLMPVAVIALSRTPNRLLRHHSFYSYKKDFYTRLPTPRNTNSFSTRRRITNFSWSNRVTRSRVNRDAFPRKRSRSPPNLRKRKEVADTMSDCSDMDIDSSADSVGFVIDYQNHDISGCSTGEKKNRSPSKSRSRSRDRNHHSHSTTVCKPPEPSPKKSDTEKSPVPQNKATAKEEIPDMSQTSKETVRKNLFDLFDSNSSPVKKRTEENTKNIDDKKEKTDGHHHGHQNETIVVRVFNQSENEGDDEEEAQGTITWEHDVNMDDADDSVDQLQSEIDPECSKLLARLKEVENEIQQEQQKLSHLENIPKVLDTILNKSTTSTTSRDSGASTPTMDEKSNSDFQDVNCENISERNPSGMSSTFFKVRIKTEPVSPPPPTLSPYESFEERSKSKITPAEKQNGDLKSKEKAVSNPSASYGKYELKAVNFKKNDTKSIYNTTNGISLPSNIKTADKTRDPRIRRMLTGGSKDTDSTLSEFNQILSRIKKEPAEDDRYGRMTSTMSNIQSKIKTEPTEVASTSSKLPGDNHSDGKTTEKVGSTPATPDDVEKTLQELGKVIKVMQNQYSADRDGRDEKSNDPKDMSDKDFRPRNLGFSSYLPEYSEGSDYTRTARVLSQAFSTGGSELKKKPSESKKKPMSSEDYFGKGKSPNKSSSSANKEIHKPELNSSPVANAKEEVASEKHQARKRQMSESSTGSHASSRGSVKRKSSSRSSRSPSSHSSRPRLLSVVKVEKQDDYERSQPAYVSNTGRVYTKGYFDALNKHNPHPHTTLHFENNVLTKETVAKKRKRSVSPERKRSVNPNAPKRHTGVKSFMDRYRKGKSRSPINSTKFEQNTIGMFANDSDHSTTTVPMYKGLSNPSTERAHSPEMREHRRPGLLGDKPGDYILKSRASDSSREPLPGESEKEIDNTLSKAMTSLLKKIIYSEKEKGNEKGVDKPAEDRMAEMVIQMMKQQLKKEEMEANYSAYNMSQYLDPQTMGFWPYQAYQYMQGNLMCGSNMYGCTQTQPMAACTDHPFVPFIKQEKNIEEFAGTSSSTKHDQNTPHYKPTSAVKTSNGNHSASKETSTSRTSTSQGRQRENDRPSSSKPHIYSRRTYDRGPSSSMNRGRYMSNGYRGRGNFQRGSIIRPTVSKFGSTFTRHSYGKGPFQSSGNFHRGGRYGSRFNNKPFYRDDKRDFSRK